MPEKRNVESKILNSDNLLEHLKKKFPSAKIGMCHGVFDVLHSGHIYHFIEAAANVDILIVSVTSDNFVNKGPGRPVNNLKDRMITLAGIEYIDFVSCCDDADLELIEYNDSSA